MSRYLQEVDSVLERFKHNVCGLLPLVERTQRLDCPHQAIVIAFNEFSRQHCIGLDDEILQPHQTVANVVNKMLQKRSESVMKNWLVDTNLIKSH